MTVDDCLWHVHIEGIRRLSESDSRQSRNLAHALFSAVSLHPCFGFRLSGCGPSGLLPLGSLLSSVGIRLLIELLFDPEILSAVWNPLALKAFRGIAVSILPCFSGHPAASGWAFLRIPGNILPKVGTLPNLRKRLSHRCRKAGRGWPFRCPREAPDGVPRGS